MSNYDDGVGDFSPAIATNVLSSPANRAAVVAELVAKAKAGGFDGVQLDLESMHASNGDGLTAFAAELRAALPARDTISIALMAADTAAGYADAGYQVEALSASVGRFVLMATTNTVRPGTASDRSQGHRG
ncbi:glycosyl hydrolase family 18 protein [Rathayibacter soli]|uniref:glycosyl hydrolase family 18 protein n=1 Tax=Rathayibacter soli TaxID=3144168 RepID=UPI0031F2EA36